MRLSVNAPGTTQKLSLAECNVFLGINGSGKSTILKYLKEALNHDYHQQNIIYFEGGRAIHLNDNLSQARQHTVGERTLEVVEKEYGSNIRNQLSQRILVAFELLEKRTENILREHSDRIDEWHENGKVGDPPEREMLPMKKLMLLFSEIFPTLALNYDRKSKKFSCSKNGSREYSITLLSDGEKQVLLILAEIAVLLKPQGIVIVDEPELNLSDYLAARLWSTLESELEEVMFIYATHDIGFSLRENVKRIFVLSDAGNSITEIEGVDELEPAHLRSFLGSIPAILSADRVIITEGKPDSFDPLFYRWILGDAKIQTISIGGCSDVFAVGTRSGIWSKIAPSMKLKGIIDRDFKSNAVIEKYNEAGILVLRFHEAESYVCIPDIVIRVATALGLVEKIPTKQEILRIIGDHFACNRFKIIANRSAEQLNISLAVSIDRSRLSTVTSVDSLEKILLADAGSQIKYASTKLDPAEVSRCVQEEARVFDNLQGDGELEQMLHLTPGKSLLQEIYKLTGAKSAVDYLRACAKHIDVASVPQLVEIRKKIDWEMGSTRGQ